MDNREPRKAPEADEAASATAPSHPDLRSLAVELRRLNGELNRLIHAFAAGQELHPTDVQALAAILDSETPLTPSLLRQRLGLTSGAVSACVDRLERAGHVKRVRESADRRVVHLHYVPSAQAQARKHFAPLAEATERARRRFDEPELAVVLRFLNVLNEELAETRSGLRG
ncbi:MULTISPECIES: MarR family transcriptional regulator [unclassified Streptomyces]|uniref:MarR family winged helix-turn-helix transcriptional regulator n=1 Tax=unclassified Streptomyces TaxID=2593676 RepID=UPI000DB94494|nr:MarR family transcriptional regulator [Streptomyces sp. PsTaAH-137]MYT75330.1 MarR family transcriptional regulator [Streptomyces sp. SID8367]RAJ86732.1 DNA-binding MarR family transcriptional regulator [Streptomyces sp. PsTaAH-137]